MIFDSNVLSLIFENLIDIAQKEKSCEFAYTCIKYCSEVSKKWKKVIVDRLFDHLTISDAVFPVTASIKNFNQFGFKFETINFQYHKLEYEIYFKIECLYNFQPSRQKVLPSFNFEINRLHKTWCPWCCIIYYGDINGKKYKHHVKRCCVR
jgi:hypothetical protein